MLTTLRNRTFLLACLVSMLTMISVSALPTQPPTLSKVFGAASVALNDGSTTLTFTIMNPNSDSITGVGFTDTLPAGLQIPPMTLTGSCPSGTITTSGGMISLSGATLAAGATCSFTVNVVGTSAGHKTNVTGNISSTETGPGLTASASIDVVAPPSITKGFSPDKIPLNGTSTMTLVISSPATNSVNQVGVAFFDVFPFGIAVAGVPNVTNNCSDGMVTASAGGTFASMSGATLAPGASCTVTIDVTGTMAGVLTNFVQVSSSNGGTGTTPGSGVLIVVGPPTLTKSFSPRGIPLSGTSTLSFTVRNPNTDFRQSLSGIGFSDTLPAGLIISTPNGQTGTCGGTITATAGTNMISLTGASLDAGVFCTFSVSVTGTGFGLKTNATSGVTSNEGGTGAPAMATMSVLMPPNITKSFASPSIPKNGSTTVTLVLTNPNTDAATGALTGVGVTDNLPAGLVVSTPPGASTTCGGTLTATAGATSVTLAGGTLAANGSCAVTFNVTGITAGRQDNSATPSATNAGTGSAGSASVLVVAPPSISKAFTPASVAQGTNSTLTFAITNPNTDAAGDLTGVGFTDTLPAGVIVASPNGLTSTCGGTATATAGFSSISLTGGAIPHSGSCTITVSVTGTVGGDHLNTTSQVTSVEGGNGNTGSATLTVVEPPHITKSFAPNPVLLGSNATLTFTITNPANNTVALTGVGFIDTLPSGLQVANPNDLAGTCGGGTITAVSGTQLISLVGATIPVAGMCTFSVSVTGIHAGLQTNNVTVNSTNGGSSNGSGSVNVTLPPPTITKAFGLSSIPLNGSTSLTFTITNPSSDVTATLTGVGFMDTLPAGIVVSSPTAVTGSCPPGTITAVAGTHSISLSGATLAPSGSCVFTVSVTGIAEGQQVNVTGNITSNESGPGGTATATVNVVKGPHITKSFSPNTIPLSGTATLTFTVSNPPANTVPLTGVNFTDTLPSGVVVSSPVGLSGNCDGGAITAAPLLSTIMLTNATLPVGGSCTFSVNVMGTAEGVHVNTVFAGSTNGGNGPSTSATLTVTSGTQPPTITKAFAMPSVLPGGTVALTFTIMNPNSTLTLTGVGFTDTLPTGLVVSTPNGLMNTCGGTATATAASTMISLSGATLGPSTTCTVTVNVTAAGAGRVCNITSAVTSNEAGNGSPGFACITIGTAPLVPTNAFEISYAANLNQGDAVINISNDGGQIGVDPVGNLCVNAYAFSPDEQMISCCSCLVTPNGIKALSATTDLISNTLTGIRPNSIVIKLLATAATGGICNPATPTFENLAPGLDAWNTTIHAGPGGAPVLTEIPFRPGTLSAAELAKLSSMCGFIEGNGSGFGICRACRSGALGADRQ